MSEPTSSTPTTFNSIKPSITTTPRSQTQNTTQQKYTTAEKAEKLTQKINVTKVEVCFKDFFDLRNSLVLRLSSLYVIFNVSRISSWGFCKICVCKCLISKDFSNLKLQNNIKPIKIIKHLFQTTKTVVEPSLAFKNVHLVSHDTSSAGK